MKCRLATSLRLAVACATAMSFGSVAAQEPPAPPAAAQEPPAPPAADERVVEGTWQALGEYERAQVDAALLQGGWTRATDPEGATIGEIHVVRFPVFTPDDPYPLWANALHVTSREWAVRAGLTIEPGMPWRQRDVVESQLNVHDPLVYAVVAVVAVERADGDGVDALVVTRDLWSLTPIFFPTFAGGVLTDLVVGVSESNLWGTNAFGAFVFHRNIATWSLAGTYQQRRLAGTKLTLYDRLEVIWDRGGGIDGTDNEFLLSRPFFGTRDPWSGSFWVKHRVATEREFQGAQTAVWDDPETAAVEALPVQWSQRRVQVLAEATRGFGDAWRTELSSGLRLSWTDASTLHDPATLPASEGRFNARYLPREERAFGPEMSWVSFQNRWFSLQNYQRYDVEERMRRGFQFGGTVWWSEQALGADVRFVELVPTLSWLQPLGRDAFVQAVGSSTSRYDGAWGDHWASGSLRWVLPDVMAGRLIVRTAALATWSDSENRRTSVGSDVALRGYANGAQWGTRRTLQNVEWRSRAVKVWSARLGMAVFADAGSAWEQGEDPEWLAAVGVSARLWIPEIWSGPRSLDIGFPLVNAARIGRTRIPIPTVSLTVAAPF